MQDSAMREVAEEKQCPRRILIDELGPPFNGLTKTAATAWLDQLRVPTVVSKTVNERVRTLRAKFANIGLKRRELYVHPDDWPQIKTLAAKLQLRRARQAAKNAP